MSTKPDKKRARHSSSDSDDEEDPKKKQRRLRRNELARKARARKKSVSEKSKSWPCRCGKMTDIKDAKVCDACAVYPRHKCADCSKPIEPGQTAYIAKTFDPNGYTVKSADPSGLEVYPSSTTGWYDTPLQGPMERYAYYHYRQDPWSEERRRRCDYSQWQSSGHQQEQMCIIPCHPECAMELPFLLTWPTMTDVRYTPITSMEQLQLH